MRGGAWNAAGRWYGMGRFVLVGLHGLCVFGAYGQTAGALSVTLTVEKRAHMARAMEYVEGGIPLPLGAVRDADTLRLEGPSGTPVPVQFEVLNRWPQDGTVRWLFLTFPVQVPADEQRTFRLVQGPATLVSRPVKLSREADRVWVDTGVVRFAVRTGKGFNVMDEAFVGERRVLVASDRGLYMEADGALFSTVHDPEPQVQVESEGPLVVGLKAEGQMATADGRKGFHYIVRIYAYAGSDCIRILPTVMRLWGNRNDKSAVRDFGLDFHLADGLGRGYAVGTPTAAVRGNLAEGEEVGVRCHASDRYELFGATKGDGPAKSVKPLTLGWIAASGPESAVAAGVRYFWETHPKALWVRAPKAPNERGRLVVRLLDGTVQPFDLISGMARSHSVLLVLGRGGGEEGNALFAAHQRPLRPWPSPEWLSRSGVFYGPLAPRSAQFPHADAIAAWDREMDMHLRALLAERDQWNKRGVSIDAYGFLAFGDTLHWVWDEEPKTSPWAIVWDSNYYDKPLLMALQWARGGGPEYFDFFDVGSWHLVDVDVIHHHPGFPLHAGSRRCPATNHVGYDPPNHRQAVGSFNFDHHKTESQFLRYYLLGDRWAIRVAMGQAEFALKAENAGFGRQAAHQMQTLLAAWWHTGEVRWRERANGLVQAIAETERKGWPNGDWWSGLILEALVKHHLTFNDAESRRLLVSYARHLNAGKYRFPNCAFGYGYVAHLERDEGLRIAAIESLKAGRVDHLGKDVPRLYRSVPYLSGVLSLR